MKEKTDKVPAVVEVEIIKERWGACPVGMRLPMCPDEAQKLIDAGKAKIVE